MTELAYRVGLNVVSKYTNGLP